MRKEIIAGNWKMNNGPIKGLSFLEKLNFSSKEGQRIIICPPSIALGPMKERLVPGLELASQNVHEEEAGAYTGELSAQMISELGIAISLVGHSERRSYYNETDEIVNKKIKRVLGQSMEAILCVGELLEEREAGREKEVVEGQVKRALEGLSAEDMKRIIIAYEPVWAIGTGRTASADDAQEMNGYIREVVEELYGSQVAGGVSILYGGSVNPSNIKELMSKEDIDGALVGGASLDPESFAKLLEY